MKVVLFCGGLGTRLRDYSEKIPKPMVPIGYRPVIWHIMKYYAYHGFKDFILCLGYKADMFKDYFVNYEEYLSNDFVLDGSTQNITLHNSDIQDWRITFVDTGVKSIIGERLMAVRPYLEGEEMFLAHYTDTLSDMYLPNMIDFFKQQENKVACFLAANPTQSFHVSKVGENGTVQSIEPMKASGLRINGGFFILRNEIFNYMKQGEELVVEPFQRLIQAQKLLAYQYDGFWAAMDTFKDKMLLDDLWAAGNPPWAVWNTPSQQVQVPKALRKYA